MIATRPFRAPHHTISDAGLVGGGSTPRPGEVSAAHHGVLFLDELPEFRKNVLEVLRQPLEERRITIARAAGSVTFPADVMLVAAMNPCPCGYLGDPQRSCSCTIQQVQRYRSRVSGPLLDRIDIQVEVSAVPYRELAAGPATAPSSAPASTAAVPAARALRRACFAMPRSRRDQQRWCPIDSTVDCSPRQWTGSRPAPRLHAQPARRRTIADLAERDDITAAHVAEAFSIAASTAPAERTPRPLFSDSALSCPIRCSCAIGALTVQRPLSLSACALPSTQATRTGPTYGE